MNIYFIGMSASMVIYILVSMVISRKVKGVNDYYVAGRRAPVFLIAGSLIASYTSTGMFMGDAAQCYDGAFVPIVMYATMQTAGYIIGAVYFGRYLRRANVITIPEYFGKRFCSEKMRKLSAFTAVIMMTVYLLSVMQGIGTLMHIVTGVKYEICVVIALLVFTYITINSGSQGVLITNTLMAGLFTVGLVFTTFYISRKTGGWAESVAQIAAAPELTKILSWGGKPGPMYDRGMDNVMWGFIYGINWMAVCMVSPWQSSRYLMARDEHTVVRAAFPAAFFVFLLEFLVGMTAVFINIVHPGMENSSQVMIWAAMNILPTFLGVVLLTGVLAAGISSATTFLSLIGSSFANDIIGGKGKNTIMAGKLSMGVVSIIVLLIAVFNPPSIFWTMILGVTIVSSSWMPVALGSILSRRLTKTGAFCGMLFGFLGCVLVRYFAGLAGLNLPVYLDSSLIGAIIGVIAMAIGSALTQVTEEEKKAREQLFIVPEEEQVPEEIRKTIRITKWSVLIGVMIAMILVFSWALPYMNGLQALVK